MTESLRKTGRLQRYRQKAARTCVALAGAALLLSSVHAGAEELPSNAAPNGGFESDMSGWSRSDTAAATAWSSTVNPRSGAKAFNWWHDAAFDLTVSQTLSGLPDGKYALTGYSQGGGGEAISRLFAETGGVKQTADFHNSGYLHWIETSIPAISVTSGSITIGFEISGAAGQWGSLDDITLMRVGDLDAAPAAIEALQPVAVSTLLHAAPELPGVVTAELSDGSRILLPVTWDEFAPEQLAGIGSFAVEGTVEGDTELRAEAIVSVEHRSFDVNGDLLVDAGDLAIVSYHMGLSSDNLQGEALLGDFDNDGILTTEDLALLMSAMLERK